ncbi:MAG: methionyl-tRNA formyltransferase [Evtepia sp.]|nr:methionyl-tRNA formyltransferase [Evtepia sp.]
MKILFMGTPDFAVPSLQSLIEAGHELVGVFTQPDKPKNRGMKLQPPPVKEFALKLNIPVYQPEKLKDGTALSIIQERKPDLIVVAAYGRILPKDILEFPVLGCINVHSSLLPKYRGAAPIHWAILNGEEESGVTIMHMAEELDAGDIICQVKTSIDPNETVESLHDRLALLGAELLVKTITEIEKGTAKATSQDKALVSYAPMLSRALSPMNWSRSAQELHNQVRGLVPWPGAATEFSGVHFKIWKSKVLHEKSKELEGTVLEAGNTGIKIACGGGSVLLIEELQAEGKRRMSAADYLRGNPLK